MEWKYYNHAMIPNCAPHIEPDTEPIKSNEIWKVSKHGFPLLARWTTEFDCGEKTNWWYCIKDSAFDDSLLTSKRRYEVNKGRKNFDVKEINPMDYTETLFRITILAFESWPEKYRPQINCEQFAKNIDLYDNRRYFGAFKKGTNELVGYLYTKENKEYIEFLVLRVIPDLERLAINAALVDGMLKFYENDLLKGKYILDGARSINHETAFQDYLEKYFMFRKAYCNLHIKYNPRISLGLKFLYLFKNVFNRFDSFGPIHKINSLFKMQDCSLK